MPDAIRTESLTKYFGPVVAIEALDLTVAPGEIYGFLGPNGAGKTTTIRILLDLVRATSGRALVDGLDCRAPSLEVRRRIGYLPAEMPLYREMTGADISIFLQRWNHGRSTWRIVGNSSRASMSAMSTCGGGWTICRTA